MGNFNSMQGMDSTDEYEDVEDDQFMDNLQSNELSEHYLVLILRQLVESSNHSGEIHLLNGEPDVVRDLTSLPLIRKAPNLELLKQNSIYQNIKQAAGFLGEEPNSNWSLLNMISSRQNGVGLKKGPFTMHDRCKINNLFLPNRKERSLIKLDSKIFCGSFSKDGNHFITGSQDQEIRVFDATTPHYKQVNQINAKHVSWCILDVEFSKDDFAYSTWADCIHISKLNGKRDDVKCLSLNPECPRFGVFSLAFSNCGKQILAGGSDGCLYAYDRVLDRRVLQVPVSYQPTVSVDVNAVGFVDESSDIFYSGTDDGVIKIWDQRCLNEERPEAVGLLLGHMDGITYIDSRNDGRYILSNSKDQSIKLWDLRVFSPKEAEDRVNTVMESRNWDYRWDKVPKKYYNPTKPIEGDTSIVTYRGHRVQKSLIRAKFSPIATTGQRYIYTGCSTGNLIIYDVLTGERIKAIEGHKDIVRDVAWHPKRQEILTTSWDFNVNINTFIEQGTEKKRNRRVSFKSYVRSRYEETEGDDSDDDQNEPPLRLRRSRRIAQRNVRPGPSSRADNDDSSEPDTLPRRRARRSE